jgi:hypothetical protein
MPAIMHSLMWRRDEGFARRVASSPSPQHLPSEGPVLLSHLVPKTSLDGGDVALARFGPVGVFEVTVDGMWHCWTAGFPKRRAVCIKRGGAAWALSPLLAPENPNLFETARSLACRPSASEIWPASSKPHATADGM